MLSQQKQDVHDRPNFSQSEKITQNYTFALYKPLACDLAPNFEHKLYYRHLEALWWVNYNCVYLEYLKCKNLFISYASGSGIILYLNTSAQLNKMNLNLESIPRRQASVN